MREQQEYQQQQKQQMNVLAKRLWSVVQIVLYMVRKGISKNKLMVDLHLMMKRGKIAGKKAIESMVFPHAANFSCRTADVHMSRGHAFYAPREYEFSCSNSPAFPYLRLRHRHHRRHDHHHHHHNYFSCINPMPSDDDIAVLRKTLDMLDSQDYCGAESPVSVLPEFGKSPMVRQLRITDSPFPLREPGDDDGGKVDKEAEEFIGRFYEQLRLQKRMAALEAMYQEMMLSA